MDRLATARYTTRMFKKKASPAKPAEQRLLKIHVKRLRLAKQQRAEFMAGVRSTQPTEASVQRSEELVKRVRAAKSADFLDQYRVSA